MNKKYRYKGSGRGVPGLPHEITDEQAKRLGVEGLLQEALKAKTYKEVKPPKKAKES